MHISGLITILALTTAASGASTTATSSTASRASTTATSSAASASTSVNSGSLLGLIGTPNNKFQTSAFNNLLKSDTGYKPVMDILNKPGANTVYIPNDQAWQAYLDRHALKNQKSKYPPAKFIVNNVTMLDIVKQHITTGRYSTSSFSQPTIIKQSIMTNNTVTLLGYGSPLLIDTNATYENFNDRNWRTQNAKNIQWNVGNGWASADIVQKDVPAKNGYLNVIDYVIEPPSNLKSIFNYNSEVSQLYYYLSNHPNVSNHFSTIKNATLFLPNNDALSDINLDDLTDDKSKQYFSNYIVPGVYYTTNLTELTSKNRGNFNLNTTSGQPLPVKYDNKNFTLNDTAVITTPNIFYNGGVIHIIDHVLSNITEPNEQPGNNSTETNSIAA